MFEKGFIAEPEASEASEGGALFANRDIGVGGRFKILKIMKPANVWKLKSK